MKKEHFAVLLAEAGIEVKDGKIAKSNLESARKLVLAAERHKYGTGFEFTYGEKQPGIPTVDLSGKLEMKIDARYIDEFAEKLNKLILNYKH